MTLVDPPAVVLHVRLVEDGNGVVGTHHTRTGRMVDAIGAIGSGQVAYEALPFRLDLE